ncbi:Zn(II)2Cys6 transcription factor domain-containing protein [Aspergillus aculeatinus CBS 121060]|uniref:C6 transcription factor n=1 Tax=Aspergillus aculeatinus CBS 121060 TaxID=1448322 RepID=A0ACD1HJ45_9EURO|nr:C6 transcription factor [Aspergillus aculeatinus CBS 121060]RAH73435.1 C6 transcription factor [Aspergillus aculeatinus CBS 121060]
MHTRRAHHKSRNGCEQCKVRRVKCDEVYPCLHCVKRGMDCTFKQRQKTSNSGERPSKSPDSMPAARRIASPGGEDAYGSFHARLAEAAFASQEWSMQDPELMHHYTLHTSQSLARRQAMQDTWQAALPHIAYSYEFLMHGILALAAVHLAYLKPERYSRYLTSSRFHIALGVRSFRRTLLVPSADNYCALFGFSSLLMVYIFAAPVDSERADPLPGALDTILDLFKICRGTLVLKPYLPLLAKSPLGPLFRHEFDISSYQNVVDIPECALFEGLHDQLSRLRTLILEIDPTSESCPRTSCLQALGQLELSFQAILSADLPLECGMIFMWPLTLDEEFLDLVRGKHAVALVLLSFYCAQLHAFANYWFVGHRGLELLVEIAQVVPAPLDAWLEWPRRVTGQQCHVVS